MTHHEVISNAVENIAFRLAEKGNGTMTPADVLPFLPVSLEMIIDILNGVAAESEAITAETVEGLRRYVFSSAQPGRASLNDTHCAACDNDSDDLLCTECYQALTAALQAEAETNGWPAQAVYEHEITYLAARTASPVPAEKLASASRFTLRRMRRKLEQMQQLLAVRKERDPETGVLSYRFPSAPYPREQYLQNMKLIRSLPASITEDVEARVVHILTALGILFLVLLGMAFWGFPFPLLFVAFLIASPILAVMIWKRRSKIDSMEVE